MSGRVGETRARAVRIERTGGAEVLRVTDVVLPPPGAGEVLVRVLAAGLNFIDVYHRNGLYPIELPATLGLEGAGVVEAVGDEVAGIGVGDTVGYCVAGLGAYATHRLAPAERLIVLPKEVAPDVAAAALLKGMTVEYLIRRLYPVRSGETVLFHAAAGGVGLIACQWLRQLGATVIGTVGSEEKAALAKAHGCAHTILYKSEDVAARVRELTDGKGVPVVYDSVGQATFAASLNSLAVRGLFVSFGNASGAVAAVSPGELAQKGSLFFTRPTLMHYCATPMEMQSSAEALFFAMRSGVKININQRYRLEEAQRAHEDLEARRTTGGSIFVVGDC